METAYNHPPLHIPQSEKQQQAHANELVAAFNQYQDQLHVLSLDCFDTLLWRKTITPKDVFFDMQGRASFQTLGVTAAHRIDAESYARSLMFVRYGHYEVTLQDIYSIGFPSLTQENIDALIEDEINEEISACYAFPPIIELIQAAAQLGKKIIIVSNTYLKTHQLHRLLASVLPQEAYNAIHTVFCSCDYNQSKSGGLFQHVLTQLSEPPTSILHLGDNREADLVAARQHGLHGLHFIQFNHKQTEYLRLQAIAATMTDASIHHLRSMVSPFRGLFSTETALTDKPEHIIGYLSMGPIMYAFARFLHEEVEQLKREGKRPKILFLMRDAFLPSLAYEALTGAPIGARVRISRFSAIAASFRSREDIARYLAGGVTLGLLQVMCRQFLLSDALANRIIKEAEASRDPAYIFSQLILEESNVNAIISQSKAYWKRLKKYLSQQQKIETGDTVILVDIGYTGRTQRALTPLFEQEWGVNVIGRYLISLNVLEWKQSRKGLIDPSWCDDRMMEMLSLGHMLLEELCCSGDNSVEDYDQDGAPIFAPTSAKGKQREKTTLIQAECLRFIRDATLFCQTAHTSFSLTMLRDVALAELARRAFFPLKEEIHYLQEYLHDENRGSNLASATFDAPDKELTSLRQHGLWFKNQNPYGLRSAGFELSLTLMAQHRHGFEINLEDLSLRAENVVVITLKNQTPEKRIISASPTYDGYFSLWFVVDKQETQVAILFGLHYQALQIEHVELIDAAYFYTKEEAAYAQDIHADLHFNDMTKKGDQFFECRSTSAALIAELNPTMQHIDKRVLRVVFRPIIKNTE